MALSFPLRNNSIRAVITHDGVTTTKPVFPPLSKDERETVLAVAAAVKRAGEPFELARRAAERGSLRFGAVVVAATIITMAWMEAARASDGPLDMQTGGYIALALGGIALGGLIVELLVERFWPRREPARELFDSEDDWGAR